MMGRPWDAAPPGHQQPTGLVSKCGVAYPGGPTHILNPSSKGGLISSSSREREGCSRTRPLKAKPCQVHDVTTTDTKPDIHHGCIPVGIAVARQRIQPYTPPLVSAEESRCLGGTAGNQVSCQLQSQANCTQQIGGCTQPTLGCSQQALSCAQQLGCAQPALGCSVPQAAASAAQLACASQTPSPWALPPPHHHWTHPSYQGVEGCGLPPVGFQLHRDPITGQLILLPNSVDGRGGVVWGSGPPPLQVMAPTQPLLLGDSRFVALAHHERRRHQNEHSSLAGVMVPCDFSKAGAGSPAGGREVSQQQVLIQQVPSGSQQVVLSSQLVEQSLGTSLVISNHQLSENTLTLNPHLVPVETGFQPTATGLVISHTETNSFLRSDINTVFPVNSAPVIKEEIKPDISDTKSIIIPIPPQEIYNEPIEEKVEISKSNVADASNQTETPQASDEDSSDKPQTLVIKEEKMEEEVPAISQQEIKTEKEDAVEEKTEIVAPEENTDVIEEEKQTPQNVLTPPLVPEVITQEEPDLSGLELLSNSIVQFECRMEEEVHKGKETVEKVVHCPDVKVADKEILTTDEESIIEQHEDPMLGGLGLLCELAHRRFIEETQKEHETEEIKEIKVKEEDKPIQVYTTPRKRPGRPKKSPNRGKGRELPPVLEPAWSSSSSSWSILPALSPPTLSPHKRKPSPPLLEEEVSVGSPSLSSSKKRKVGRPRKRDDTPDQTETIVAKNNLMSSKTIVGLLLANHTSSQQNQGPTQHKIRPKLKAETKVKAWCDDDEDISLGKLDSSPIIMPTIKVPSFTPEPLKIKRKPKTPPKLTSSVSPSPASCSPKLPKLSGLNEKQSPIKNIKPIITKITIKEEPIPTTCYKGELTQSSNPFVNKIILKKDVTNTTTTLITKAVKKLMLPCDKEIKKEVIIPNKQIKIETPPEENRKIQVEPLPVKVEPKVETPIVVKEILKKETPALSINDIKITPPVLTKEPPKKEINSVGNKETPKKILECKIKKEEKKEIKETRKSDNQILTLPKISSEEAPSVPNSSSDLNDPTITVEHLSSLPRRVLFTQAGLLYAGQLTEVTPPDLYSVTLDKERGHKPHILATEQILTDTMLEVKCEGVNLPVGTRLCAYWSQQYRCLYPGTVYEPSSPSDPFVSVEFDDGDNGKINRTDVRLLPKDYPITECDANPLHGIGQRKRNNSSASTDSHPKTEICPLESAPAPPPQDVSPLQTKFIQPSKIEEDEKENENINEEKKKKTETATKNDSEEERRRLKKKKKMELKKLLANESVWQDLLKYKRKHRELYKMRHKHKHKHRHKKHKHKRSRSCGERVVTEPEPIKPLIFKVHNRSPPTFEPEQKEDEEEEEEEDEVIEEEQEIESEKESKDVTPVKEEPVKPTAKPSPKKGKKERQASIESKSKMAVFLPARQLWTWHGKGFKRGKGPSPRARKKIFYKSIKRQDEIISVGDCAVFLSTGRPDRPYIGKIEQMWECWGSTMLVRVSWFYHPEETVPKTTSLPFPGGLFESPHVDENDVQTISHKCDVLSFEEFKAKMDVCPDLATNVYDNNDTYYLAGSYDPTHSNLTLLPQVKQN